MYGLSLLKCNSLLDSFSSSTKAKCGLVISSILTGPVHVLSNLWEDEGIRIQILSPTLNCLFLALKLYREAYLSWAQSAFSDAISCAFHCFSTNSDTYFSTDVDAVVGIFLSQVHTSFNNDNRTVRTSL